MPEFSALVFATAISMLYRSIIAVIAPELSQDLNLTDSELGTLASLFFVGFAAVQLPVGIALDRLGPRLTIVSFMLLAITGTALFASSDQLWMAYTGQLLIGAGCAPLM
ncbi:MFS transporter, partial [Oceanospirillum sp. HFRX-1_2]